MILHKLARAVYIAKSPKLLLKEQEAESRRSARKGPEETPESYDISPAPVIKDTREYPSESAEQGKELLRAGFQQLLGKQASLIRK